MISAVSGRQSVEEFREDFFATALRMRISQNSSSVQMFSAGQALRLLPTGVESECASEAEPVRGSDERNEGHLSASGIIVRYFCTKASPVRAVASKSLVVRSF